MSSNETQAHKNACTEDEESTAGSAADGADLTAFQYNCLEVVVEDARYGLAIKAALEAYYGEKVNHGRLYPNLDTLVERGLIEKSEYDKRTNLYEATADGEAIVCERAERAAAAVGLDVEDSTQAQTQACADGGREHRLANAEPADVPANAEREDGEAVFDGEGDDE